MIGAYVAAANCPSALNFVREVYRGVFDQLLCMAMIRRGHAQGFGWVMIARMGWAKMADKQGQTQQKALGELDHLPAMPLR